MKFAKPEMLMHIGIGSAPKVRPSTSPPITRTWTTRGKRAIGTVGDPNYVGIDNDPRVSEADFNDFKRMLARQAHYRRCHASGHRGCKRCKPERCPECRSEATEAWEGQRNGLRKQANELLENAGVEFNRKGDLVVADVAESAAPEDDGALIQACVQGVVSVLGIVLTTVISAAVGGQVAQ